MEYIIFNKKPMLQHEILPIDVIIKIFIFIFFKRVCDYLTCFASHITNT